MDTTSFSQCQASCRDGSSCLNTGKFSGYCWLHNRIHTQIIADPLDEQKHKFSFFNRFISKKI